MRNTLSVYDNPGQVASFESAFQLSGAVGSSDTLAVPLDTIYGSAILEIANTSSSDSTINVLIFSSTGRQISNNRYRLKPRASEHVITDRVLDEVRGIALIRGSSIIATAM